MSLGQKIVILLVAVFYIAYFTKMFKQRQQGIRTNQMGKGEKTISTRKVEKGLSISTLTIVAVELISIIAGTQVLGSIGVIIGSLLMLLGDVLFIIAMWTMRSSWRAGIPTEDKTELITSGIYRISRNPAFLGFDLVYIGIAIAFTNIVLILFTLITMVMLHLQILEEEKFLTQRFGNTYESYKKQVGRYFIGL